ncbi:MAG: hypothetical protein ACFE94_10265 [Candidatus Hodarchaeota archaeon]
MSETFKILEVICPMCGETKSINIPESIFSQKKFGTIKIQVPVNAVCSEHQFIVFVDTKGVVRGYEKIDIQMAVISPETEVGRRINLRNLIQIFGIYGIFSLIHAKVFNYPSYIIKNKNFEYNEGTLNMVGDMILPERFQGRKTIYLLDDPSLNKLNIKEKDVLIMDTQQHIFQTPWNVKMKFEEGIVKRALEIIDEQEQLKLLQQDIGRLINEANHAIYILQGIKDIYEDELIDQLSKDLKIKTISNYRLALIKEFIRRNISKTLASKIKSRVGEFLSII